MLQLRPLLLLEGPQKVRFHQLRRPRCISRCQCVLDRLLDQALPGIPGARSPVQRGQLLSADACLQALLQQLLEQMVKAIPPLALIEGDKKEVRVLHPVQACLHLLVRGITPHDHCTQLGAKLVQYRGPHEQLLDSRGELVQHFLHQVTAHMAVRGVAKLLHE